MTAQEFFFSSGWGFGLTITSILLLILNIIQFINGIKNQRLAKQFTLTPMTSTVKKILDETGGNKDLDIPYIYHFSIFLRNTGNVDLSKEFFQNPIEYDFKNNVEFLGEIESSNNSVKYCILKEPSKIVISPFLLKRKSDVKISGYISCEDEIDKATPYIAIKKFKIQDFDDPEYSQKMTFSSSKIGFSTFITLSMCIGFLFFVYKQMVNNDLLFDFSSGQTSILVVFVSFVLLSLIGLFITATIYKKANS